MSNRFTPAQLASIQRRIDAANHKRAPGTPAIPPLEDILKEIEGLPHAELFLKLAALLGGTVTQGVALGPAGGVQQKTGAGGPVKH